MTDPIAQLETNLNSFDLNTRSHALADLLKLAQAGKVPLLHEMPVANMHCHTFFSYNAYGHSPTSLAWLAKKQGYKLLGIVDFDVLDAVDEFLGASDLAAIRGTAGIETRVFIPEFASREINSPGEPGVYYHMGIGFTTSTVPPHAAPILDSLRNSAAQRYHEMVDRINAHLAPITVDYEKDILPLTPAGNPTERHIVLAYVQAVEKQASDKITFWATKLGSPEQEIKTLIADTAKFQNHVRSKLMKKGGVGYIQPGPDTFPSVETFHELITACGALPCAAWLDGTTLGEKAIEELLSLLVSKGVVALNIIPDRNWNITDPESKRIKLQNLYQVVEIAQRMALPLNIGTEMNSFGQKLVDDFDAPELAPIRQAFLDGAHFIFGHTMMQRHFGMGYQSAWASKQLPSREQRNAFFTAVGYRIKPNQKLAISEDLTPEAIVELLKQVI